jgi:osmotically-inducible protein OsmY
MTISARPFLLAAALLAAAPMLSGCLFMEEKTLGESLDDSSTGTEIKTRLFADGARRFSEVDVEVASRFVLLSGRVAREQDKADAERIAWSVRAVDEVANEITIEPRNLGRDVNDRWINEQLRARLIADGSIKGVNYNIQVNDGVVFLLGLAQDEQELRKAAETASMVRGVRRVVSYVKMRDRRPPPSLARPESTATVQPAAPTGEPASTRPSEEVIRLAPIEDPARPPTTRQNYPDPYASGPLPPARPSNQLESAPRN